MPGLGVEVKFILQHKTFLYTEFMQPFSASKPVICLYIK